MIKFIVITIIADMKAGSMCHEVPPPKPPRCSSSVTGNNLGTTISIVPSDKNCIHEYEYVK